MFNGDIDENFNKPKENNSCQSVEENSHNDFKKLFKDFASDTSSHGIAKATLSSGHLRRFVWFLICATCYSFTIYMSSILINTYMDKPTKTKVDILYEKKIHFPAVTVCNLNPFRKSRIMNMSALKEIVAHFGDDRYNKTVNSSLKHIIERQVKAYEKMFADNIEKGRDISVNKYMILEDLFAMAASKHDEENLKKVGHQFHNFIMSCRWGIFDCNSGAFKEYWVQTWNWRYGNCFTFNFGINQTGHDMGIQETRIPGPSNGLTLELNIEQHEYLDALIDEAGAIITIHNAKQLPFPYYEGITVPPGFSSSLAIRMETMTRVDPFKNGSCNSSPFLAKNNIYRNYLSGSVKTYSVKACMQSCLANAQLKRCNCSAAKYAIHVKKICKPEEMRCINEVSTMFKYSRLGCSKKCPQPCLQNSFLHTLMTSTLTSKAREKRKRKEIGNSTETEFDFDKDFVRVKIFYNELNHKAVVQSTYYDLASLFGDIGGLMGLCVGVSVISIAEFGELLISLCILGAGKARKKKRPKTFS
ncbi:amiloride-sensitive sodium channel subunit alpha-like isoform X2 [Dendronephthya gigantea]|nr:amiloride-sensitive sodium channel subunit alpha-like isoform X2 [Dendronephthya gigantea]